MTTGINGSSSRIVSDVTCLGCGCLCDDIQVEFSGDQVTAAQHACSLGLGWFTAARSTGRAPNASIDGQACDPGSALEHAAKILANARSPLLMGLTPLTIEAQRLAVTIADEIGASIDPMTVENRLGHRLAVARVGEISATLGEVRDRADLVVFWGCDPARSHPRHLERYSAHPIGRFIPDGRTGRIVVVVDEHETDTARFADLFLPIARAGQLDALCALRALVRGSHASMLRATAALEPILDALLELSGRLKAARYAAFFSGEAIEAAAMESLLLLVRDLNLHGAGRSVHLTLGGPLNSAGAEAVLGWQAGASHAVDYTRGFPRFLPWEAGAEGRLSSRQADAALVLDPRCNQFLTTQALTHLRGIPVVWIARWDSHPTADVASTRSVVIRCADPGRESGGTVMRCDGVMLPLTPTWPARDPTMEWLLGALLDRLHAQGRGG